VHRIPSILKGIIEGEKSACRLKMMLLDWMFDKKNKWKYPNVKELAQDRDACPGRQRTRRRH